MADLKGKTVFVTGASRGIGLAIALRVAADGANVAVAAKTAQPHPKLAGTIYSAAEEVEKAGGTALPLVMDVRDESQVRAAIDEAATHFGGLDILVNNASAISLTGTLQTPAKRYDLMHQVNVRGTYLSSQAAIPHLLKSENPHVLNLSPPLNMEARWFGPNVAYTMTKFGMSMCVLGMAEEFRPKGIAFNALWPKTTIATAAIANVVGDDSMMRRSRKPAIMGDAAHAIFTSPSRECTGNFFVDEVLLRRRGVTEFDHYAVDPAMELMPDFFL